MDQVLVLYGVAFGPQLGNDLLLGLSLLAA
jgi:hypothetical protein